LPRRRCQKGDLQWNGYGNTRMEKEVFYLVGKKI